MAVEIVKEKKKNNSALYPKTKGECVYFINDGRETNMVMADSIISMVRDNLNMLTDATVKWITENKNKYACYGLEALAAVRNVGKVYKNGNLASSESQKNAVEDFFKYFVNNLWIYENGIYDKKNTIVSRWVGCYFVGYRNYDGEVYYFPLAVVKSVLNDASYMEFIIEGFSFKCSQVLVSYNNRLLSGMTEANDNVNPMPNAGKIAFWAIWVAAFIYSLITGIAVFSGKLKVPEWESFKEISVKTNGFFQALRAISSRGFEMNINDTLIDVILVVSAAGLFFTVIGLVKFVIYLVKVLQNIRVSYIEGNKNKVREYVKSVNTKFSYIGNITETLKKIDVSRSRIIKEKDTAFDIYLKHSQENTSVSGSERKKTGIGSLVVLFILISSLVLFVSMAENVSFRNSYYKNYAEMKKISGESRFSMDRLGKAVSDITVYALPDSESIVLCNIVSGENYTLVNEKEPVEGYTKIKYQTEYGTVKGWVHTEKVSAVIPNSFETVYRIKPYGIMSSTDDQAEQPYPALNVIDNNPATLWKVNKDMWSSSKSISEFVEIHLTETTATSTETEMVHSVGFTIGNGPGGNFEECGRPSEVLVEFKNHGATVKNCKIKLQDIPGEQFYFLNKPIECDVVRVNVSGKVSGEADENVYMAEVQVYVGNETANP